MIVTDLETVNPNGRLDVLLYRGAQMLLQNIEKQNGLQGIWENAKPLVNELVVNHISGLDVPAELKMILGIMQANWKRGNQDEIG